MRYGDLHADTLTLSASPEGFLHRKNACASLGKLIGGGCFLQCFAVFCRSRQPGCWQRALRCLAAFEEGKSSLAAAGICGIPTVEDGGIVEGRLDRLETLAAAGVRLFGFTWNEENCLGYPCGERGGLKRFGRLAAELLLSRGVYPDVSHLSDEGAAETIAAAKRALLPAVASHSLSREICPHRRNLSDPLIRAIADGGGLVGVNFVREFIGKAGLFAHIKHIAAVGGEDCLALGSDFDGTDDPLYAGADEMPRFFDDMKKAGFSARLIEKFAFGNVSRLFPPP